LLFVLAWCRVSTRCAGRANLVSGIQSEYFEVKPDASAEPAAEQTTADACQGAAGNNAPMWRK
jgi:hypothetical protein